jgi:hypothetical protein
MARGALAVPQFRTLDPVYKIVRTIPGILLLAFHRLPRQIR